MSAIKPGFSIEIILQSDYDEDNVHFLKASVYDVLDRKIILSQTSPPLPEHYLDKIFKVTYFVKNNDQMERWGFTAKLTGFMNDYEIDSRHRITALAFEQKSKPEPMNVRLNFRIRPPLDSGLSLSYRGNKLNLMDISLSGARFSENRIHPFKPGETIRLKLGINQSVFELDARINRIWKASHSDRGRESQSVAVKFSHVTRDMESLLSNKLMTIQRELLARGKMRA